MNTHLRTALAATAAAGLAGLATGQVVLTQVAEIDLNATADATGSAYIGSNPSGVAWTGARLFVAGFNNDPVTPQDTSIVEVTDPLGTPGFGLPFGTKSTPPFRGYSGLDVDGGALLSAWDGGASDPDGIKRWNLDGTAVWAKDARGNCGPGFDPGFDPANPPVVDDGVGWTTFGSGRRSLQDLASGADIYTPSDGMIITVDNGTFWRDLTFDPGTGTVWAREGNNVVRAVRTGGNSVMTPTFVFDPLIDSDFTNGQNIGFVNDPSGDFVIYNDRETANTGQDFFAVTDVVRPDGSPVSVDWGSFAPPAGSAYYDYSYDRDTRTLAVLDFVNRLCWIFEVGSGELGTAYCPGDGTGGTCPCGNFGGPGQGCQNSSGQGGTLAGAGSTSVGLDDQVFTAGNLLFGQPALLFVGDNAINGGAGIPFGDGLRCAGQNVVRLGVMVPDAGGGATWGPGLSSLGAWGSGDTRFFQCWYRDPVGGPCAGGFNLTNGLEITFTP